jgi:hypothetical protein
MRKTFTQITLLRLALLGCSLILAACASVSVREDDIVSANPPKQIPDMIYVQPFSYYEPGVRVDRSGAKLETFEQNLQDKMAGYLVTRLSKSIGPAKVLPPGAPLPQGNYWLITGRFDRVNQGSRLLRMLIGCGAGGTKLETRVVVYDLSGPNRAPFLALRTTGGSNISPGAITGISNVGMGAGMALNTVAGLPTGLTYDSARTSHEITASISDYLRQEGAISDDQSMTPKRLGHLPDFPKLGFWPFNGTQTATSGTAAGPVVGTVNVTPAKQQ